MNASQTAIDLIKSQEGCILHTYLDSANVKTIGYGSTMLTDGTKPQIGLKISQQQAENLLHWEVTNKTAVLAGLLKNCKVNQNQFDALTSFVFNVGIGAFEGSTLFKKMKVDVNDPTIRDEFMKWNKITKNGVKVALDDLTKRRSIEADLYFKPIV